jgi:hypothetical protein
MEEVDRNKIVYSVIGILVVLIIFFTLITFAASPVTLSSRISPTNASDSDNLIGYCNSSDGDNDSVAYYYIWYKDGIFNQSGVDGLSSKCYQESANISTSCGGLDTGSYNGSSNFSDGNWSTYSSGNNIFYVNYSKPNGIGSSNEIIYKSGTVDSSFNVSDYSDCSTQDMFRFKIETAVGPFSNVLSCDNGKGWFQIYSSGDHFLDQTYGYVYEEAMNWTLFNGSQYSQGTEYNVANLSSNITSSGENWTFSCLANDGLNNASSWVNSSVIISSSTSQISLSGGGGGGGTSKLYVGAVKTNSDLNVDVGGNKVISFQYSDNIYEVKIDEVKLGGDYMKFSLLEFGNEVFQINIDETRNFDLDEDGEYDISITLNGIGRSDADITFSIFEETVDTLVESCLSDWVCEVWSNCENGIRTRDCNDVSNCGSDFDKPSISESCEEVPELSVQDEKFDYILLTIIGLTSAVLIVGIYFFIKKVVLR